MSDIVVLGSLNMDLVVRCERMPSPGETVRGDQFATIPGGKGANQAAASARLGASVEMIGRVGTDAFGPVLLDNLASQGVGATYALATPGVATGIAVIILDGRGENSIVIAAGANNCVSVADLEAARPAIAAARCLIMQFEIPLAVVRAGIALARSLGIPTIVNAAPASNVEEGFLRGVGCLVVNEFEAQTLTGLHVSDTPSASRAGQRLLELGVSTAVVTLGARGAYYTTGRQEAHVPARQVHVVDTTAAGDAFVGGLAVATLKGLAFPDAVRYATCAGTLATTVLGAQTSLPSAAQVNAFYDEGAA